MNQPLISGRAEVESGTVYFQQKEFEIKKGVFDFINPYKIEPTIDIQSEVNIRKWSILLNISGTPDTLKINMTSDPAESEKDIVSLLIAGKTTQELIEEEGGIATSPTQILANVLSEKLEKEVQDATGLDVVELEYQEEKNNEEANDVKVTVGETLSRRVNVRYGIQTKNAKVVQQVIAEYKFLEKLLINTFRDSEGNFGGEFQFRLEFR
jgi:translocation and assembly module TamB